MMSDFDPKALEAIQRDTIDITITREQAEAFAFCLNAGVEAAPDERYAQDTYDDLFGVADRIANFARTGIDDPDACYCVWCGQPDEPDFHDPARCHSWAALHADAQPPVGESAQ